MRELKEGVPWRRVLMLIAVCLLVSGTSRCQSGKPQSVEPPSEAKRVTEPRSEQQPPSGAIPAEESRGAAEAIPEVSLATLSAGPEKYSSEPVRIVGTLDNEGTNFFTDLRVVLKNDAGDKIYVRPWLPMSTPPSPRGGGAESPGVLSQYLGKTVELIAVVERGSVKKVGEVYLLKVDSCRVVE